MNNRTENLKLIISADGKLLGAELGREEQQIKRHTNRIQDYFGRMNRAIGSRLKSLVTSPLAIVGGTAGLLYAGKQVVDYQDKLSTMGITAGLTAKQIMMLDQAIYKDAYTTGQSRDKILEAMIDIFDKTGDFKFVQEAISGVAKSSTGMSAELMDSARILSAMKLGMGATAGEAESLFDILARMGNIGSFPFAQQAQQAERLFASSTLALGITKKNFAEYAAFIQSVKPVFGTGDIAATAIERVMMDLATKKKEVQKAVGFKLFDEKGAIFDFKKTITAISKLDITKRAKIFGEFGRAFIPLASDAGIKVFERYIAEGQRAGFIADAFNRKQSESKFQINALATAANQFADNALSPIIKELTDSLNELTRDPEKMQEFTQNLRDIGEIFGHIAKAIGFAIDKYVWFYNLNKRANIGGMVYQTLHPKQALRESGDAVARYNRIPREMRAEMMDRLNNGEKVNLSQYINRSVASPVSVAAPEVKNNINMSIVVPEAGPVVVASDNANTTATVKTNRGSFK